MTALDRAEELATGPHLRIPAKIVLELLECEEKCAKLQQMCHAYVTGELSGDDLAERAAKLLQVERAC